MRRNLSFSLVIAIVVIMAIVAGVTFLGCTSTSRTPEAMTYDTLEQSRVFIDAYMAEFDRKVDQGGVSIEKQIEVNRAYVRALEGIRAVAVTVRDGVDPQTPEEVRRLVENLTALLITIVPPPTRD